MYRSLTTQTLHYFARSHAAPRLTAIAGPAAWRGSELAGQSSWRVDLGAEHVEELDAALRVATETGKGLAELVPRDFPLPSLAGQVARWRDEIQDGRGFLLLRGLPVERWGRAGCERAFFCLGLHLGTPGAQNADGDLLGHVRDTGESPAERTVRLYRTRANIAYHCDAADAVGLLCLQKAKRGGASRIVSSVSVYNELLARRPDLVERLYQPFLLDTHGQNGLDYFPIAPCRHAAGRLRTFWHSDYFRSAQAYTDAPRFEERDQALIDIYEEIASSSELYLDMEFEPGDVQLLSNHTILHARTEYEDHQEPERKRHLLRLWLSFEGAASVFEHASRVAGIARMVATLGRYKLRRRIFGPSPRSVP